jgi:transmembrane sensor
MDASERRKHAGVEAADWFARLQAGKMERAERQQFVEWLRESHIHVTEMLRIAQIHGDLKEFPYWARISTGPKTPGDNIVPLSAESNVSQVRGEGADPRSGRVETRRMPRMVMFAVAASAALVVATALVLPRIRGQIIDTERGERREVTLSDGSVLQVDPETRLRIKYGDRAREVFLERGRAVFHVAKNAQRPFLVQADGTTVRAVGTAFGVEQQRQGIVVTVAEGKVAVISAGVASPQPSLTTPLPPVAGELPMVNKRQRPSIHEDGGAVFLTSNQQVTVTNGGTAEPIREIDSQRALAWAEGRLIFQNDELSKAVAEFNHYNRVQLAVTDPGLAAKPVSGVFNAADPEAFIAFLQSVTAVEVNRDGDESIAIGPAQHR